MDAANFLPNDLRECQRLLLAAFKQATNLEQRVAELNRVLEETAASYQELQQEHAATLDELAWYKRWAYGRRRERLQEDQGQGHLFDLEPDLPANGDHTGFFLGPQAAIQEVACWAHARRKFFDAVKSYPREAHQVLEWIRQLYDIEDRSHTWSAKARLQLRLVEAVSILDKIESFMAELAWKALPKSSLAKAVHYARNQWAALRRYTADGRLTIDNNVSERTLRH